MAPKIVKISLVPFWCVGMPDGKHFRITRLVNAVSVTAGNKVAFVDDTLTSAQSEELVKQNHMEVTISSR